MSFFRAFVSLAAMVILGMGVLSAGGQTTWTVTDLTDSDSGSLRAAINNANGDTGDLIVFAGGLSGTITLESPLPTIGVPMTIAGPGANTVAISGASLSTSMVQVNVAGNASVAITGLTFEDLNFSGGEGDFGVVVLNTGNLTLNGDAFLNNAVSLDNVPGGGAVVSFGTSLTVSNCTFSNNVNDSTEEPFASAISQYAGTMLVVNSTFNQSLDAGAILSRGTSATIANNTFTGNNEDGFGGSAIFAAQGTVTSSNNVFANNSDMYDGPLDRETDGYYGPVVLNSYHDIYFGNSFISGAWTSNCDDCTTQVGPVDATSNPVGTLAPNGGTVQTELPLPGSGVICAGLTSQLPVGTTTDARGNPRLNTSYPGYTSDSACLDAGAVQSNYDFSFTKEPPASQVLTFGEAMSPAPEVTVTESGSALTSGSATVSMTDTAGKLNITPQTAVTIAGVATFASLEFTASASGDTLTAALSLNPLLSTPLGLTTTSTAFDEQMDQVVPNVVGDTQAAAENAITTAGLVVGTVTPAASTTVPIGDVISESPAAGTPVNGGTAVNIFVSTGTSVASPTTPLATGVSTGTPAGKP